MSSPTDQDTLATASGTGTEVTGSPQESAVHLNGDARSSFPWFSCSERVGDVIWRYPQNPIIDRHHMPDVLGIFNSAVVPFGNEFAGVFRVEKRKRFPKLHFGTSTDGLHWRIDQKVIEFETDVCERPKHEYAYDPRITQIEDTYYITWCSGATNGPSIGMAHTKDFKTFHREENLCLPFNRNGVLFPRKINGYYWMLSRPSDDGHTPFGEIFASRSPDLVHWGSHRVVMSPAKIEDGVWWESTKIGAGPVPIETSEGWLLIYHGVMTTCNGFEYSMGAALLDLDEPWRVKYRAQDLLMAPEADYEVKGHVDNVVFPCAALFEEETDRLAIYYGAADTSTCVAFCEMNRLIDWIKSHSSTT